MHILRYLLQYAPVLGVRPKSERGGGGGGGGRWGDGGDGGREDGHYNTSDKEYCHSVRSL